VKLADFGLSKLFTGASLKTACGTPFYVAPDILLATDDSGYGPEVDMWAVGVLIYILLSGRLPFSGDDDEELFKNILEGDLVWKSPQFDNVSGEAKDLISHLIVVDPTVRYSAKVALTHPWISSNTTTPLHNSITEGFRSLSTVAKAKKVTKK